MSSLRFRLGVGSVLIVGAVVAASVMVYWGMREVGARLDSSVAADRRLAHYATLSTRVSTFLVIATETIQSGLPQEQSMERLSPVVDDIFISFEVLQRDVTEAVAIGAAKGVQAQSRFGAQSLGLARMQALLRQTVKSLADPDGDPALRRVHLDNFANRFDPLLSQAAASEVMFRNQTLAGIEALRRRLSFWAFVVAGLALALVVLLHLALLRPLFARLRQLRDAARQIGAEDFDLRLPSDQPDEIGQIYSETNRMAAALRERQERVASEWARLNQTIEARTRDLQAAKERLEHIDQNRRRFFADVSHELRTPLTVILMEAQIGQQGAGEPEAAFATIEARAKRLNRRIDDLLRIARSESGQLALDCKPVSLPQLVEDMRGEVMAEVENAGLRLICPPVPDATLTCDPNWMRQITVGLIRNVIRHARAGGAVQLLCRAAGDGGVDLSVTDNGAGIAAEDQARVFERFDRGSAAGQGPQGPQGEGFGIGLALTRWVIEAHGGGISLVSPVPKADAIGGEAGTKVILHLPAHMG